MILNILILLLFIILTSYTDIKEHKVKNIHLIIFAILFLIFAEYTSQYLFNFMFTFGFSILLWMSGLIPAGDSKLLMVYALGIPSFLVNNNFPMLLVILIGLLIPSVLSLIKLIYNNKISVLKNTFSLPILLLYFSFFQFIFLIFSGFNYFFELNNYVYLVFSLFLSFIFFTNSFLRKMLAYRKFIFILVIINLIIMIDYNIYFFRGFIYPFIFYLLFDYFKTLLTSDFYEVNITDLKPGMMVHDIIARKNNKIFFFNNKEQASGYEILYVEGSEGLDYNEIKEIKEWGVKKLKISQELPLAPYFGISMVLIIIFYFI